MREIYSNNGSPVTYDDYDRNVTLVLRVFRLGGDYTIEVNRRTLGGPEAEVACFTLRKPRDEATLPAEALGKASQALTEALSRVMDWKKDRDSGLFVPKVEPGSTVLVDKPGAAEIKVLDLETQAFERIPKRALTVRDERPCTCPARDLLSWGCRCGAREANKA